MPPLSATTAAASVLSCWYHAIDRHHATLCRSHLIGQKTQPIIIAQPVLPLTGTTPMTYYAVTHAVTHNMRERGVNYYYLPAQQDSRRVSTLLLDYMSCVILPNLTGEGSLTAVVPTLYGVVYPLWTFVRRSTQEPTLRTLVLARSCKIWKT